MVAKTVELMVIVTAELKEKMKEIITVAEMADLLESLMVAEMGSMKGK